MIYGSTTPVLELDEVTRTGIRTIVLSQRFEALSFENSISVTTVVNPPKPPIINQMMLVGAKTTFEGGSYVRRWNYEGGNVVDDGSPQPAAKDSNVYTFKPGFAEVSLILNPNWDTLVSKYGASAADDGTVSFTKTLADSNANALKKASPTGSNNPYYGQRTWFRMEGTFTHQWADYVIPPDLFKNVGTIVYDFDNMPDNVPPDRDWLKCPPTYVLRGNLYEIEETYWLSGPGGWPAQVYDFDQVTNLYK